MLETIKRLGQQFGKEVNRAWENLAEGWRELLSRSNNALTHFKRDKQEAAETGDPKGALPSWALLASEVRETEKDIVVELEAPGMEKDDFNIHIDGNTLYIRGEKQYQRDSHDGVYHVMERAYGSFQRSLSIPKSVDSSRAEAGYSNGVLRIRLPKAEGSSSRQIKIQ